MKPLNRSLLAGATLLAVGLAASASAANYTWSNGANTSLWGTAGNWVGSPALTFNNTTDIVFDNASVVNRGNTVAIGGNRTIRSLTIGADYATSTNATLDIRTYTTAGAGSPVNLTFAAASGNASITVAQSTSGAAQVRLGTNGGGNVVLSSNLDLIQNNTFFGPVGFQFDSAITGAGTINKSGAGLVRLLRVNSGWSGGMNINEGNVAVSVQPTAMGTGAWTLGGGANNTALSFGKDVTYTNSGGIVVAAGAGTRTIQNDSTNGNFTLSGGTIDLSAGKDVTFNVTANGTADTMTIGNAITGTGGVAKTGNGTLTLSNSNSYNGTTSITAGTLRVGNGTDVGSIGSTSAISNNGTLVYNVGAGNRTLAAAVSGTGSLIQSSANGTLTLSNNNSYTGTTSVTAGKLVVNGNSSTANGNVSVASGASLGGVGTIGGATTLDGILAPGNSIGTITVNNNVTWNGAATTGSGTDWQFELGLANYADLLDITGAGSDFIKGTAGSYRFDFLGSGNLGTFKLVDWVDTTNFVISDFSYTNLGAGKTGSFAITGSQLDFTVIPEPRAALLGSLGLLALLRRRRP
jgi:fibronectin-binding autotransporter adhesin